MIRIARTLVAAAVVAILGCGGASAEDAKPAALTDASLVGKWVVNLGKCTDPNAEFLTFSGNGAVESMRDGRADAVGFWKLDNDRISLTVLAPPARFDEKLKDMSGYYAFDILIATYNIGPDAFEGVGILGEQTRYAKFARCRS